MSMNKKITILVFIVINDACQQCRDITGPIKHKKESKTHNKIINDESSQQNNDKGLSEGK